MKYKRRTKKLNLVIKDYWNPRKTWLVRRDSQGHWSLSQAINGVQLYPFRRIKRYAIEECTWLTFDELNQLAHAA